MSTWTISVALIGAQASGKTNLLNRMLKKPYQKEQKPTLVCDIVSITGINDIGFKLWDFAGDFERPSQGYYEILVYCIDLASFAKKNAEQQQEFETKIKNTLAVCAKEHMKVILVGTKADECDDPEAILNNILKDETFEQRIVTSAKENKGIVSNPLDANYKPGLKTILLNLANAKRKFEHKLPEFPNSYIHMWDTQQGNEYSKALKILADYSKVPKSGANGFFASVKAIGTLAITGHWARHHHDAVRETLKELGQQPTVNDVSVLLNTLRINLLKQGNSLKRNSCLEKRIQFIQNRAGVEIINRTELNQQINDLKELNNTNKYH